MFRNKLFTNSIKRIPSQPHYASIVDSGTIQDAFCLIESLPSSSRFPTRGLLPFTLGFPSSKIYQCISVLLHSSLLSLSVDFCTLSSTLLSSAFTCFYNPSSNPSNEVFFVHENNVTLKLVTKTLVEELSFLLSWGLIHCNTCIGLVLVYLPQFGTFWAGIGEIGFDERQRSCGWL